jgi:hypothetical protein
MSGPRYKFQGTGFYVLREFEDECPDFAITDVTNANPVVVESADHGRATGDVIYVESVGGTLEINDRAYIIEVIDDDTFSLVGVNSTNWGTYTSGGTFQAGAWSEFCSTGWNRTGGSRSQIEATDSCSTEQEFEGGLAGPGTLQLSFNWAPKTSTAQVALAEWEESGDTMAVKLVLPKNGGTVVRTGFVQQTSEQAGVNGLWTASANIQLSGKGLVI